MTNVWDAAKAVLRGKFITYTRKILHFKKLEKEKLIKPNIKREK